MALFVLARLTLNTSPERLLGLSTAMNPRGVPDGELTFHEVMSRPVAPQAALSLKDLPGPTTAGSRSLWQ